MKKMEKFLLACIVGACSMTALIAADIVSMTSEKNITGTYALTQPCAVDPSNGPLAYWLNDALILQCILAENDGRCTLQIVTSDAASDTIVGECIDGVWQFTGQVDLFGDTVTPIRWAFVAEIASEESGEIHGTLRSAYFAQNTQTEQFLQQAALADVRTFNAMR